MSKSPGGVFSAASRSAAYLTGIAGLRNDDCLLSSFPRSGSTWIRLFLCNVISLQEWDGREIDFATVNDTMPALGLSNLLRPWPHRAIPRVVKTHRSYSFIFGKVRSVGIVRDPRDVMVSYFHFARDRNGSFEGSFSQFLRHRDFGLEAWFKHYDSWRGRWNLLMKYEVLRSDPATEFTRLWDEIGVEAPRSFLQEAISRSDLSSARKSERAHRLALPEERFVRSGDARQWLKYFNRDDEALYEELAVNYDAQKLISD